MPIGNQEQPERRDGSDDDLRQAQFQGRNPDVKVSADALLSQAVASGASDLHLVLGAPPCVRLNGQIVALKEPPLTLAAITELARQLVPAGNLEPLERGEEIDFSYMFRGSGDSRMCRGCASPEVKGPTVALRIFPNTIPTPQTAGLPPDLVKLTDHSEGIIFVTGPTGSGKSTTLAALVNWIAVNRACRILTIEQPVEYRFDNLPGAKALISQIAVPDNVRNFAAALRRSLRKDPDVIMVGEARDFETIETAVNAAHTGHLVLATLHSNSAADAVERCISLCGDADKRHEFRIMLSSAFLGAFSQRLLPKINNDGRVMAFELLKRTDKVQELIEKGDPKELATIISRGKDFGMRALDDHLCELIQSETVDLSEAVRVARNAEALRRRVQGYR